MNLLKEENTITNKIKIKKQDIHLQFLLARDMTHTYKVSYIITIIVPEQILNPMVKLSPAVIDMASLKQAILDTVDPYDRQYMTLALFDDKKAEFHFETDKWLKDTLTGVNPITRIEQFNRVFMFKKRPPNMIMFDPMRQMFEKYIIRKFNEYMEKNHKEAVWFKGIFPESLRSKIRQKVRTLFDWQYDMQWNKITATLKPMYIMAALYATGSIIQKIRNKGEEEKPDKQEIFKKRVMENMPTFDTNEFKKLIKKRGFV